MNGLSDRFNRLVGLIRADRKTYPDVFHGNCGKFGPGRAVPSERQPKVVPVSRWTHRLSEIDLASGMGLCANCGRVRIYPKRTNGYSYWQCSKAKRAREVKRRLKRPMLRPWRQLVGADSICARCGFVPEDPCQLDVHRHRHIDHELLCANCHRLVTKREARAGRASDLCGQVGSS